MVATGLRLLPVAYQCVQAANEGGGVGGVVEGRMGRRQRAAEAELAAYSWMEPQTVVNRSPW